MESKIGCFIIHGFGGSLEEINQLKEYLNAIGIKTVCPILKGHGKSSRDLKGVKYSEWISSAEEEFIKLGSECDKIYLAGFSMGGLISINIAIKHEVQGIIFMNTPVYHWDIKRITINIMNDIQNRNSEYIKFYLKAIIAFPIEALYNFKSILIKTKPLINSIDCPIFIAQALKDDTVHKKSAEYIFKNISSEKKLIKYYKNSNHIICQSPDKEELFDDIREFVQESLLD